MIKLILVILALVCFLVSAFGLSTGKVNLTALGLAFLAASFLPVG